MAVLDRPPAGGESSVEEREEEAAAVAVARSVELDVGTAAQALSLLLETVRHEQVPCRD